MHELILLSDWNFVKIALCFKCLYKKSQNRICYSVLHAILSAAVAVLFVLQHFKGKSDISFACFNKTKWFCVVMRSEISALQIAKTRTGVKKEGTLKMAV